MANLNSEVRSKDATRNASVAVSGGF